MLLWRCFTSRRGWGGVGWGGVGWGINVHSLAHRYDVTPRHVHLHLRTYVMLLWRCFTSRRGWGGVGWGGVLMFTHLRTAMMWRHGTFTCTCAHTSCYFEDVSRHAGGGVGWGGVGWGINVHSLAHRYDVTPRHVHLHLRTYVMLRWRGFTSRRGWGGVGWGGVLTFTPNAHRRHWCLLDFCWRTECQIPWPAQLVVSPTNSCGCTWEVNSGVGNVMTKTSSAQTGQTLATLWAMKRGVRIRLVLGHKTL